MARDLTAAELSEWIALADLHGPWWYERADVLNAINCQVTAAAAGASADAGGFLPKWGKAAALKLVSFAQGVAALAGRYGTGGR